MVWYSKWQAKTFAISYLWSWFRPRTKSLIGTLRGEKMNGIKKEISSMFRTRSDVRHHLGEIELCILNRKELSPQLSVQNPNKRKNYRLRFLNAKPGSSEEEWAERRKRENDRMNRIHFSISLSLFSLLCSSRV